MTTLDWGPEGSIYFETFDGDPLRPVLLFLHEGLGCTAMWRDFPLSLCQVTSCRGLVFDRRGFGRSSAMAQPRGADYLHRNATEELPRVIQSIIPHEDFVLIGHSDGGSIGLIYAAQQPSHLLGVITEAAHIFVEPITLEGIRSAISARAAGKLSGLAKYHPGKDASVFHSWSQIWLSDDFKDWNIEALLPSITCPLLVLQGRDDAYGTEAQVNRIVELSGGRAQPLLVEHCGHAPHHEQPDLIRDSMAGFIRSLHQRA